MNILITIKTDSELLSYEAISLAFVLASFDHQVQIFLSSGCRRLCLDDGSRLFGMIQSLSLYDLPPAWVDFEVSDIDILRGACHVQSIDESVFDAVLEF